MSKFGVHEAAVFNAAHLHVKIKMRSVRDILLGHKHKKYHKSGMLKVCEIIKY